jgi:hypothetical protein
VLVEPASPAPVPAVALLVDPASAVPAEVVPAEVVPAEVVPAEVVSVGLVLGPPEEDGLDVGDAGVEELLPGADEDPAALGLAVLGGSEVGVEHGAAGAPADVLPPFALSLAFAEAVELAVLVAVAVVLALSVAVAVAVSVAVAVAVTLLSGLLLVLPLAGLLTETSGDGLGAADLAGAAVAEADGELVAHPVADAAPWAADVPP